MTEPVISIRNLGKRYQLGATHEGLNYKTLRDVLTENARKLFRLNGRKRHKIVENKDFWALKDISFDVQAGEVVGIIGRNGAGKTTLLKLLSQITEPTEGEVILRGRVASLLEVGTGFHPELSGRENIYLNGAILGMTRAEIKSKFGEIVAFAEVEKFLDTPVKRYSSGMYVRLAFSVAAHLEPEILLIDEVLAVGDQLFQKKCFGKMSEVTRLGRTILFISHNMSAVGSLCSRTILLEGGRIIKEGKTKEVIDFYLAKGSIEEKTTGVEWEQDSARGDSFARIKSIKVLNSNRVQQYNYDLSDPIFVQVEYWILKNSVKIHVNVQVYNVRGVWLFTAFSMHSPDAEKRDYSPGLYRSICNINQHLLNVGIHTVTINLQEPSTLHARAEDAVSFEVVDSGKSIGSYMWASEYGGEVRPLLSWNVEKIGEIK